MPSQNTRGKRTHLVTGHMISNQYDAKGKGDGKEGINYFYNEIFHFEFLIFCLHQHQPIRKHDNGQTHREGLFHKMEI